MSTTTIPTAPLPPTGTLRNASATPHGPGHSGPSAIDPLTFTSTVDFAFTYVPSMSTCDIATILWNYTGPTQDFSLYTAATHSQLSLIAYSLPATAASYVWTQVNVTEGVYELLALGNGFASLSSAFFVSDNGGSCLDTTVPSSYRSPPTSPPPASPPRSHLGVILGSVIGGIAVVVAILGVYLYLRLRGKAVPGYRWRSYKDGGKSVQPRSWAGLSSHLNISNQRSAPCSSEEAATVAGKTSVQLTMLPRLEPNRRKPSIATVTLLSEALSSPAIEKSLPASPSPALRLDDELPPPPSSYVAPAPDARLRRPRTFDTVDSVSVIWLRRHSSAVTTPTRRPSGTSAVPSSSTSQMYRGRDSMWSMATPSTPETPERPSPDRAIARRSSRALGHTSPIREPIPDVPPLPSEHISRHPCGSETEL
ncbi:hypothetical protein BV20DRAFT_203577 [Pilatotrama ljubarskyi]|nr:hypothetical protein BV20DRAFT_203577 [Pilatotrama ljubarskyi]